MNAEKDLQAADAMFQIRHFMPTGQKAAIREFIRGEEGEHYLAKLTEYAERIKAMPKPYESDGQGEQAIVSLHYFIGQCDWWITERDSSSIQHQAFGLASLGYGSELGYISIAGIIANGAELDLYWTPITLAEVKAKYRNAA